MRYGMILLAFTCYCSLFGQGEITVWIDTDIGNDFDDDLALAYGLSNSAFEIEGISTTHWRHEGDCRLRTADSSAVLLRALMKAFIGRPKRIWTGSERKLSNVYGEIDCASSTVVNQLIAVARAHGPDRRLHVISLGAATHVAMALCRAPDIADNIRVYMLGAQYDAIRNVWNKNEFNVQNDLAAFDYLLEFPNLDFYIMPANVGRQLRFLKSWISGKKKECPLKQYLLERWDNIDSRRSSWVAYDLALVMAIAQPQWVGWSQIRKPPENGFGNVRVATYLDNSAMEKHLFELWSGDGE